MRKILCNILMPSEEKGRNTLLHYYKTIASTKFERSLHKTGAGWLAETELGHAMIPIHDHIQIAIGLVEN